MPNTGHTKTSKIDTALAFMELIPVGVADNKHTSKPLHVEPSSNEKGCTEN